MNVGNINKVGFGEAEVMPVKKSDEKSLKNDTKFIKPIKNSLPMVELGSNKDATADPKIHDEKISQRKSSKTNSTLKKNTEEKLSSSVESGSGSCSAEGPKKSKARQTKAQKGTLSKEIDLLGSKREDLNNSERGIFARELLEIVSCKFLEYIEERGKVMSHMQECIKLFENLKTSEKAVQEAKGALMEAQRDYKAKRNQLDQNVAVSRKIFDEVTAERCKEILNSSNIKHALDRLEREEEKSKHLLEKGELEVKRLSDVFDKEQGRLCEQTEKIRFQELQKNFNLAEENLKKAKDACDAAKNSLDFARAKSSSNFIDEGEIDIFALDDFWDEPSTIVFGKCVDTNVDNDLVVARNNYDMAQQNYNKAYERFNGLKSDIDKANRFLQPYTTACRKAKLALESAQRDHSEAKKIYENKRNANKEKRPELDKALKEAHDHYDKNLPILNEKLSDAGKAFCLAEKERDEVKQKVILAEEKLSKCREDYCYYKRSKNSFFGKLKEDLSGMQKVIPNIATKTKDVKDVFMQLSQVIISAIDDKIFDEDLIKFLEIRKNNICESDKKLRNEFDRLVEKLSKEGLEFSNEELNSADISLLFEKYLSSIVNGLKRMCNTLPLPLNARNENGVAMRVDDGSKTGTMKDFIIEQVKWYQKKSKSARTEGFRQICMSGPAKVIFANLFEPEISNFYLSSEKIR